MRMTEAKFASGLPIDGYGPGFFRVSGQLHSGPLALFSDGPVVWQGLDDFDCFLERAGEIDVLLIGMGAEIRVLERTMRERLQGAGIGAEVMATPSACRTYNVLLTEGRRIAAALIPI